MRLRVAASRSPTSTRTAGAWQQRLELSGSPSASERAFGARARGGRRLSFDEFKVSHVEATHRQVVRAEDFTSRVRSSQAWFSGSEALSLEPAEETEILQLPSLEAVRKATGLGDINPNEVPRDERCLFVCLLFIRVHDDAPFRRSKLSSTTRPAGWCIAPRFTSASGGSCRA